MHHAYMLVYWKFKLNIQFTHSTIICTCMRNSCTENCISVGLFLPRLENLDDNVYHYKTEQNGNPGCLVIIILYVLY